MSDNIPEEKNREPDNAMKKLLSGFGSKTRKGMAMLNTLKLVGKATRYSQDAEKQYWDVKNNGLREGADFDRAEKIANEGLALLDEAEKDFPMLMPAFINVRQALVLQLEDIRKCRAGVIDKIDLKVDEK